MRKSTFLVVLSLTLLSLPALAQKGKGGKGGKGGTYLPASAWFEGSAPNVALEGSGPFVSVRKNKVIVTRDTGIFGMDVETAAQASWEILVWLEGPLPGTVGSCEDYHGPRDDVTPPALPTSPAFVDFFRAMTWEEVDLIRDSDGKVVGYERRSGRFNLLAMDPGDTRYLRFQVLFQKADYDNYFTLTYNRGNLATHGNLGIVQVTAASTAPVDTWTFEPVPEAIPPIPAGQLNVANLRWYLPMPSASGKGDPEVNGWCNMGDFVVPFQLKVTTNVP